MDLTVYLFLLCSLIISTICTIWFYKKTASKWLGVIIGFGINTVLLTIATVIFYKVDHFKGVEGLFASLGILIFAFFIPIITCINFYILEMVKHKIVYKH
ncbi:hypothetical protein [Bacillus sp. JCM 19034]|uniref:hypothetical protein n=1 Tax=Bacillus sp. JCM 19034 TaxID=1481928 RepID=UPI0007806985|nr:hypothetical protein [Bacillus sp. JCM 19034]